MGLYPYDVASTLRSQHFLTNEIIISVQLAIGGCLDRLENIIRNEFKCIPRIYKTAPVKSRLPGIFVISQIEVEVCYVTKDHGVSGIGKSVAKIFGPPEAIPDKGYYVCIGKFIIRGPRAILFEVHCYFFPATRL